MIAPNLTLPLSLLPHEVLEEVFPSEDGRREGELLDELFLVMLKEIVDPFDNSKLADWELRPPPPGS